MSKQKSQTRALDIVHCRAENLTFGASINAKNIKLFINIIRAMNFMTHTEIQLSENGLKLVVEESKSFQVSAYLKKDFFSKYFIRMPNKEDDCIAFGVALAAFTNLSSAFFDNDLSNLTVSYFHRENTLVFACIQIDAGDHGINKAADGDEEDEEPAGEIKTEYYLKTMNSNEPIDFELNKPQTLNSIILGSLDFQSTLNTFDRAIEELEFKITPKKMTLRSVGIPQFESILKFASGSESFDSYESFEPSKFSYSFNFFKVVMKALPLASKVSINTHADGVMRLQLLLRSDETEDSAAYMEFNMIPKLPDDGDEDD